MKKIFCILLVMVLSCSFVISAGAWSDDDTDDDDYYYDDTNMELRVNTSTGIVPSWTAYSPGEWPGSYEFYFGTGLSKSLFKYENNGQIVPGHGLSVCFILPLSFVEENASSMDIVLVGTGSADNTKIQYYFDNEQFFVAEHNGSLGRIIDTDLSYYYFEEDGYCFLVVSGTLLRECVRIVCAAYVNEGKNNASYELVYRDADAFFYPLSFVVSDDAVLIPPKPESNLLGVIGETLGGILPMVGNSIRAFFDYAGFYLMIGVPLCVGILTWVTAFYKRRRG